MNLVVESSKCIFKESFNVELPRERYIEAVSRFLWPWKESLLLALVGFLALLDYVSTYAALELSTNKYLFEGGSLANWALKMGGFTGLFLFDIVAITILLLTALTIRSLHYKFGFKGYGRTAFVLMLVPYVVIAMAAICNNIVLTFL